jgi:hypothetical protein
MASMVTIKADDGCRMSADAPDSPVDIALQSTSMQA